MSQVFTAETVRGEPKGDPILTGTVIVLVGIGLAMLFSASYNRSEVLYADPYDMVLGQGINALIGLTVALLISKLRIDLLRRLIPLGIGFSFLLMVATFIPGLGASYLGGHRWILIAGHSLQPSELVKLVLVLYLASILSKKGEKVKESFVGILPPLSIVILFVILIFAQNNFSTAVFVLVVSSSIFFLAGVKIRYFLILCVLALPLLVGGVMARDHRMARLNVFFNPGFDPSGAGYQTRTSIAVISNGGLLGEGPGMGTGKLGRLPEAQSDFIFAVIAEELGFVGVLGILGLFALFAWRGYRLAFLAEDSMDRLLAFGTTTSIVTQVMMNVSVTAGIVPPTGVPLPFFSSGGSSLLFTLCMVGLLLNVSQRNRLSVVGSNG